MKRYSNLSILVSLCCLGLTAYHNYILLTIYNKATGKDKALFGIHEALLLDKMLFIGLGLLISLVLAILSFKRSEIRLNSMKAIVLFLATTIFLLLRPWTFYI